MIVEDPRAQVAPPTTSTDVPAGDGDAPQRVLDLLLADDRIYDLAKALIMNASGSEDDRANREARILLDRIEHGLDEAHARADRLLARLT